LAGFRGEASKRETEQQTKRTKEMLPFPTLNEVNLIKPLAVLGIYADISEAKRLGGTPA